MKDERRNAKAAAGAISGLGWGGRNLQGCRLGIERFYSQANLSTDSPSFAVNVISSLIWAAGLLAGTIVAPRPALGQGTGASVTPASTVTLPSLTTPLVPGLTKGAPMEVFVPATSDPWLTGTPGGSMASRIDIAPDHSPVFVAQAKPGQVLAFSVTGRVGNVSGKADPPDGGEIGTHDPENGLAGLIAPVDSLVGIFLDDNSPITNLETVVSDYAGGETVIHPGLRRPFFIGAGLTGTGTGAVRQFITPDGATRFYLGTMESWGWANKVGGFHVKIVVLREPPNPGQVIAIGAAGVAALFLLLLTMRKRGARGDEESFFADKNRPE